MTAATVRAPAARILAPTTATSVTAVLVDRCSRSSSRRCSTAAFRAPRRTASPRRSRAATSRPGSTRGCASCAGLIYASILADRHRDRAVAVRRASPSSPPACSPRARSPRRSSASPPARRWPTSSPGSCWRSPSRCASATGSTFEGDVRRRRGRAPELHRPAHRRRAADRDPQRAAGRRDPAQRHDRRSERRSRSTSRSGSPPEADAERAVAVLAEEPGVGGHGRRGHATRACGCPIARPGARRRRSRRSARPRCAPERCGACALQGSCLGRDPLPAGEIRPTARLDRSRAPGGSPRDMSSSRRNSSATTPPSRRSRPEQGPPRPARSSAPAVLVGVLALVGYVVARRRLRAAI